ncbi:hypothetical protein JYB55_22105 [Mycolicibacterium septicum]|nr:hypothetical protein [Mycolicibacterium septicum]
MGRQMIVILELVERKSLSILAADHIAERLLGTKGPRGEVALQRAVEGEITPTVAYQLTEAGATFTLSGTSHRVHNKLLHLHGEDFGPGTRVAVDDANTLLIKSCAEFPQPDLPRSGSERTVNNHAAFNQALDAWVKLTSLAIRACPTAE